MTGPARAGGAISSPRSVHILIVCYAGRMRWHPILWHLFLLFLAAPAMAAGPVKVVDGDTLQIGTVTYRFYGIDAPEKDQICRKNGVDWLCGQEAAAYLRRLIGNRQVRCREKDRDRYGRIVAICWAARIELNREMVRAGLAWAYTDYARDYEDAEREAQIGGRGFWAGEAQPAWEWRRQRRRHIGPQTGQNPGLTAP